MYRNKPDCLIRLALLAVLAFTLLPVFPVSADIGPKPAMSFRFDFKIAKVDIVTGTLIECEDAECKTGKPLEEVGPQRFKCYPETCSAVAYGFKKYNKLVIKFTDRTRESNVFTHEAKSAIFNVTVTEDRLSVVEIPSDESICQVGALLTILIEMILASLYLSAFGLPRLVLGWVPFASLVTLPFVWAVFPLLIVPGILLTAVSEVFAVGVETVFLHRATARALNLRHAFLLSLLMNAASFGVGLLVLT